MSQSPLSAHVDQIQPTPAQSEANMQTFTLPEGTLIYIKSLPFRTVGQAVVLSCGLDVHKLIEGGPLYAYGIIDHPEPDPDPTGFNCSKSPQTDTE